MMNRWEGDIKDMVGNWGKWVQWSVRGVAGRGEGGSIVIELWEEDKVGNRNGEDDQWILGRPLIVYHQIDSA